jgi:hypothetical protein
LATVAVLSQQSPEDDKWHLVAYYSKSLNAVERNYKIHDKEMLAVMRALEDWHHFLEGAHHKVEIWTDHKNLEYFMMAKKLNRRQARWSLYLSRFNFSKPSPDCHWKEKSGTSFGIFARETTRASRRTLSQSPQRNSENPRESRSERRSGQAPLFPRPNLCA